MKLFGQACKRLENVSKAALFSTDEIFCLVTWHKINHCDLRERDREKERERERKKERIARDRRMQPHKLFGQSRIVVQEHLVSS